MIKAHSYKKVLLVAGGTGGHIFPALSVYECLKKNSYEVSIVTDIRGFDNKILACYKPYLINVKGYAGKKFLAKVYSLFLVLFSTIKSIRYLKKENFDLILGFGSYVQVPVLLAAKILNINFILHEANAVLGKANRVFWKFAEARTSFFELNFLNLKTIQLGMPVRPEIDRLYEKKYLMPKKSSKITLLILGGSLGAEALSYKVSKSISLLPKKLTRRVNIIHQVKENQIEQVKKLYKSNNIKADVKTFIKNMDRVHKIANLIICRAGASTIAENLISGVPAIYIPLNHSSNDHQYLNALKVVKNKSGWLIREKTIETKYFVKFIKEILTSEEILKNYSDNSKKIAMPAASKKLLKLIGALND